MMLGLRVAKIRQAHLMRSHVKARFWPDRLGEIIQHNAVYIRHSVMSCGHARRVGHLLGTCQPDSASSQDTQI